MNVILSLFNDIICYPLGGILKLFFSIFQNYALLLIIFTLIVRFCLFPLAIKQQRSSAEMLRMKPKMEKIQKKHAKDQTKLNEEMQKLYQEEGYSPLAGCLPLLVQLPILYGLLTVVYNPLTYIMWFSQDKIDKIAEVLRPFINSELGIKNFSDPKIQLYIAKAMSNHMDKLGFLGNTRNIDFSLFGLPLDLSAQPKLEWSVLVLIPILCYVTQALSSWFSVRMNKKVQQAQPGGGSMNMMMVFVMPLMSAWFALQVPAAVGFYWIVSNLFMLLQVLILQKYFSLERLAAEAQTKAEKRKEDIRNGKVKPNRMAEFTKRALEAQKQRGDVPNGAATPAAPAIEEKPEIPEVVKVNSKGNKSRSQLKEEQRRRLANSRNKNIKG
jgi:YidC/Oxa1 family membrane protein insertase